MNRKGLLIFAICALHGCGTVTTLSHSDEEISDKLKKQKTYCESLPRPYSGLSYGFCKLHSKNDTTDFNTDAVLTIFAIDMASSSIADTIILPYSIYAQKKYGSIPIK